VNSRNPLAIAAVVLGIAFIAIAIMYWTVPAKSLPGPDFLGHSSGDSSVHVKHGLASLLVGLACFAYAWFQSGPKKSAARP
jgi:hypothetical protein